MKTSDLVMVLATVWIAPTVPAWMGVSFGVLLLALSIFAGYREARK